jgi:hypothetical protein
MFGGNYRTEGRKADLFGAEDGGDVLFRNVGTCRLNQLLLTFFSVEEPVG